MTLENQVDALLNLISNAGIVVDTASVKRSLHKATSPRFEIVFAGTFSAGKSTLINTLLERKLLFASEGVATGTECYVEYAQKQDDEKAVLYFFSKTEIQQQISELCKILGLADSVNLDEPTSIQNLRHQAEHIKLNGDLAQAKQAELLQQLLDGFVANKDKIQSNPPIKHITLEEAKDYVRWENAAVFKQIKYYCNNSLLKNGIVIVDTPGIDAPLSTHTQITYDKIAHPDTSAVVCVLQTASRGSLTEAEINLIEHIRNAPAVRDRIFYVFNHIDATWYNPDLHRLLESVIHSDFHTEQQKGRVYKTSAMLGFYGSLRRNISEFEVPDEFKIEFNRFFFQKVSRVNFPITPAIAAADTEPEKFQAIIDDHGDNLLNKLIQDSGVEGFKEKLNYYLMHERKPQLFQALAKDLQPICNHLRQRYFDLKNELAGKPVDVDTIKKEALDQLSKDLFDISQDFSEHIREELNEAFADHHSCMEQDYAQLQRDMRHELENLIANFSVQKTYHLALRSHEENVVVPVMAILSEAFYYLTNGLKKVLTASSQQLVNNFFDQLTQSVSSADYYKQLQDLLGNDAGINQNLDKNLREKVIHAITNEARTECEPYIRETALFYAEGTVPHFQLRHTLFIACQVPDFKGMSTAEPAVRQLLKLDFEKKVENTILCRFRTTINETINSHLLPGADHLVGVIIAQCESARTQLEHKIEKDAERKIKEIQQEKDKVKANIGTFNQAVDSINQDLQDNGFTEFQLPTI
jgi:hypothetical protein